jgi:hypothetical protein
MHLRLSNREILSKLFLLHGVITFAAGIALIFLPNLIPNVVGISLAPTAYLVPYLLGTAEFCIAVISIGASKLKDISALRIVSWSFIVLHGSTAIVEFYAYTQGLSGLIWGNIALRIVVVVIFAYFGLYQLQPRKPRG